MAKNKIITRIKRIAFFLFIFGNSFLVLGQSKHISFNNLCYPGATMPPEELNRKKLEEPGMKYGNPYTMFVKDVGFNLQNSLQSIRDNIRNGQPFHKDTITNEYFNFLNGLFDLTVESPPCDCSNNLSSSYPKNNEIT